MSTGRLPFSGGAPLEVLNAIASKEPESISRFNRNIPQEFIRIVRKCLEKESVIAINRAWIMDWSRKLKQDLEKPKSTKIKSSNRKIDSLAVLPFISLSADPELEYLSDGITESLINNLSPRPSLEWYRDQPCFDLKKKQRSFKDRNELAVSAVFIRTGTAKEQNLSIRVELIDVAKDAQIGGSNTTRKFRIFCSSRWNCKSDCNSTEAKTYRKIEEKITRHFTKAGKLTIFIERALFLE